MKILCVLRVSKEMMMSKDVPVGYKLTEVGVIPEDWEVKSLGDIGEAIIGLTYSPSNVKESGLLVLRSSNIFEGRLAFDNNVYVDVTVAEKLKTQKGDILICVRNGSRDLIGKCALIDERAVGETFGAFMTVFRTQFSSYAFLQFQSNLIKKQIHEHIGATINQITNKNLRSFKIPLPPCVEEQEAIALVLSDTDALITSLDKLIAKKCDIKQAAMQQLLTGKQQLEGFSGDWEVKRLGDVLKVRHGKSQHNVIATDGKYPILATGGEIGRTNAYLYNKPSVLIGRKGTIDSPQYVDSPFWTIDTLFFTEIFDSVLPKFIYYKFNMINWRGYNEASGVPSLNASTIESIEFNCPKIEEQQVIAKVLSDMDSEISALEQRRDKTKALKQAMMQELLTGRIRLL
ncbi:MAG: restriction endonuclease subunit S [Pseudanabaena sp.]